MLGWALTFLVVAVIAGILGFGGISSDFVKVAKVVFFVALLLFAGMLSLEMLRDSSPV